MPAVNQNLGTCHENDFATLHGDIQMTAETTITILKQTKKHVHVSVAGEAGTEQRKFSHEAWADYQRSIMPCWGSHRPAVEFVFPEGTE